MTMFPLIAVLRDPRDLDDAMAPYDVMRDVAPYPVRVEPERALGVDWHDFKGQSSDAVATALADRTFEKIYVHPSETGPQYFYLSTRPPMGRTDGWRIGGRFTWRFQPRDPEDPRLLRNTATWGDEIDRPGPDLPMHHWVAGGPREALDLDATRMVMGRLAVDACDREPVDRMVQWQLEWYGREGLIKAVRAGATAGTALLTLGGEWIETYETARRAWIPEDDTYRERVNAYLDDLPGDAWIMVVQCHM